MEKRSAAERYRIYGSQERIDFVFSLGCLICGAPPELAHTQSGGMGRKADARTIVPLCPLHHSEQHQYGTKTFEASYGLDLKASAAWIEARWQDHLHTRDE